MSPLRNTEVPNVVRPRCLLRRTTGRRLSRHATTRTRGPQASPSFKDKEVPKVLEDPQKHGGLPGFMALAELPPSLGAQSHSGALLSGVEEPDSSNIKVVSAEYAPAGVPRLIEEVGVDAGDVDDFAVAHKQSIDASDEDHSTVAPSDLDVSSDEDMGLGVADALNSSFELHPTRLSDCRADFDIERMDHSIMNCRDVNACCEYRGKAVDPGQGEDADKVHRSPEETAAAHAVSDEHEDDGWEDRGAAAASKVLRRILSNAAPLAEVLPLPFFPGSRRCRVSFDLGANTIHEIPPYGEIYGSHPRTFVFDRHAHKVPASPSGYVSLQAVIGDDEEDEDLGEASSDEEEVLFFEKGSMLRPCDNEDDFGAEDSWESYLSETSGDMSQWSLDEHACIHVP